MNNPSVTIVIATYNSSKTIRTALDSVKKQKYQDWECLVVDGASKDDTIEIVKEYVKKDSRFRYISEPDKGVYDAFNKGWKMAKGQWIHYLGSDDVLTTNGIHDLIQEDDGTVDILNGHCYVMKIDGKISHSFSSGYNGCHQGKLMRKSALQRLNGFDTQYKILADVDLFCRAADSKVSVHVVNTFVAYFSMDGISQNLSGFWKRTVEKYKIHKRYGVARIFKWVVLSSLRQLGSIIYRRISAILKKLRKRNR